MSLLSLTAGNVGKCKQKLLANQRAALSHLTLSLSGRRKIAFELHHISQKNLDINETFLILLLIKLTEP